MPVDKPATGANYLSLAACFALCLLGPLSGLAQGGLSPAMPQISQHFASLPNAGLLVRLMVSGLSAAMIFGALVSGFLSERVGQLRLLIICLVLYGLFGAAGYVLDNLYMIVGCRVMLGVVNAAAGVLAMALITTRVATDSRDRWLGFYIVTGTIGTVVLTIAVGAAAQFGWRNAFLVYLIALPIALFVALTFSADATGDVERAREEAVARGKFMPWGKIVLGLLCGAIATGTFMYLPFHLAAIGMGAPKDVATALVLATALGGLTSFAFGWIRKVLSAIQLHTAALTVCAVGLLIVVLTRDHVAVLFGVGVYGAGLGLVTPNLFSGCAAATPAALRPRMLGLLRAGFYSGPLIAQLFLEMVLSRGGSAPTIAGIAAICAIAAIMPAVFPSVMTSLDEAAPVHA